MPLPQNDDGGIGQEEADRLQAILEDAECSDKITDWEREFCVSLSERIGKYGARTFVSDKQMEVIERIEEKLAR